MFPEEIRFFSHLFSRPSILLKCFVSNQMFFKCLVTNTIILQRAENFLNVLGPMPDYFRIFFAQIWYFSNVLDTNTVFQKYLNSMSLKWFQRRSHIFWIFWGTDPKLSKSIVYVPQIFEGHLIPAENDKKVLNIYANIRKVSCW